jgi:hypothetical protein
MYVYLVGPSVEHTEQIKTAWNDITLEFIIKVFITVQMLDDRNGSEDDHAEYSSSSDVLAVTS